MATERSRQRVVDGVAVATGQEGAAAAADRPHSAAVSFRDGPPLSGWSEQGTAAAKPKPKGTLKEPIIVAQARRAAQAAALKQAEVERRRAAALGRRDKLEMARQRRAEAETKRLSAIALQDAVKATWEGRLSGHSSEVSLSGALAAADNERLFEIFDKNRDGQLDRTEFSEEDWYTVYAAERRAASKKRSRWKGTRRGSLTGEGAADTERGQFFHKYNVDGDAGLDLDEFRALVREREDPTMRCVRGSQPPPTTPARA